MFFALAVALLSTSFATAETPVTTDNTQGTLPIVTASPDTTGTDQSLATADQSLATGNEPATGAQAAGAPDIPPKNQNGDLKPIGYGAVLSVVLQEL